MKEGKSMYLQELKPPYPAHYHTTINALIAGNTKPARVALARSLRVFRAQGKPGHARELRSYTAWIGFPARKRPNGRYR
jgi:hypothetical protein